MEINKNMNTPSQNPKKIQKKRLSQEQVQLLEANFDSSKKLESERKFQLARELGVPPRQIAIWYQNKKARWKSQTLELDHSAIQLRLEAALAEKRRLAKEVNALRGELKHAQDMLFQAGPPPMSTSLSSCCSSLNDDVGCSTENWGKGKPAALQFEELYACLMVGAAAGKVSNAAAGINPGEDQVNERDFWV